MVVWEAFLAPRTDVGEGSRENLAVEGEVLSPHPSGHCDDLIHPNGGGGGGTYEFDGINVVYEGRAAPAVCHLSHSIMGFCIGLRQSDELGFEQVARCRR